MITKTFDTWQWPQVTSETGFGNSLWPDNAIWRNRSGSTLARVMAYCLMAPSHYLNQCWLLINEALRAISQRAAKLPFCVMSLDTKCSHDDVIKWKHFPHYWPFVWGIHRSPVNSPHKGQWHGALMFSLICAWINGWVNNGEAGDLRCHCTHYDLTVMKNYCHISLGTMI